MLQTNLAFSHKSRSTSYRLVALFSLLAIFLVGTNNLLAQKNLNYWLPSDVEYNPEIPKPQDILGYQVGEWHVEHAQLVAYMKVLASVSDRITVETFARTYENRPLLLLTVTSPENHKNIEDIRQKHLELSDVSKSGSLNVEDMPNVIYQGFSIHGNEASGSNAALLYAYYLAAAKGKQIDSYLKNTVVLLDPCFNPDGLNRFAVWANTHKSKNLIADGNNWEHNEVWPGGRTNHYWFDLNRDWLLQQHPESQGRINNFYQWRPTILTDHHEMGTNSTFFFMPGIQSRIFPLTPKENQELTFKIGDFHARKLDKIGSLYFRQERFDDFYVGKGSTYPDVNGTIGILFEQASSRGHLQESANGNLSFPFTIRNQFTTALSTLEAANGLRTELLDYQRSFFKNAKQQASSDGVKAYVFGEKYDRMRLHHFMDILLRHNIKVYRIDGQSNIKGESYPKGTAYAVPTNQQQYTFIKSIFDTFTNFEDSLFYDVSSWTMPYAFNIKYEALRGRTPSLGDEVSQDQLFKGGRLVGEQSRYAYAFEWDEYYAPRALNRLLKSGYSAKVMHKTSTIPTAEGVKTFNRGTILVPLINQVGKSPDKTYAFMKMLAETNDLKVYALQTGKSESGSDLGSSYFSTLKLPKVAMIVGDGVRSYDAGEVWHLLDQRFDMELTMIESHRFGRTNLSKYNTLIMVDGSYGTLGNGAGEKIKSWVQQGGNIVAMKGALNWLRTNGVSVASLKASTTSAGNNAPKAYADLSATRGAQVIGGTIFNTKLDLTHPLGYGYRHSDLTVFKRGTMFLEPSGNPYATPLRYTNSPLASGYISKPNLNNLKNTAAITVNRMGGGRVVSMAQNPNFRAYFFGTNKLFMNAIFFSSTISGQASE